jgi:Domain of unknown function (DUF397)
MNDPRKSSYSSYNGNCVEIGSYRTSGYSEAGNCVEVGEIGDYRKTAYSVNNGACVEVGTAGSAVGVRDTKQADKADRTELRFPGVSWGRFIRRLQDGERV